MFAMQGGHRKGGGARHDTQGVRDTGGRRAASEPARSEANEARELSEQRWIRCRLEEGAAFKSQNCPFQRWGSFMISNNGLR